MATIYDVAKSAGVSPKTVSRVLNRDAPVSKSTRAAVEAAMSQLSYVPSFAARSMRSNRSGLVGLVSGGISSTGVNPELSGLPEIYVFQGVQEALKAAGRTLLIVDTGGSADAIPGLFRTLAEHRVEGVIYVADYHRLVSLPDRHGIAELVIANGFDRDGTPAVVPDDYAGQRNLVARLMEIGHRQIAYMTLPEGLIATRDRTRGWRDAHDAVGLAADPALVRESESFDAPADSRRRTMEFALSSLLALPRPPTVICAGNDRLAMQIYGMLRSRGLRVPEDISVAGYDDHRLITENLFPPLTTVDLPYHQMGMAAAGLLLKRLSGEAIPSDGPMSVPGEVIWRDSVIAPRTTIQRTQLNREKKT